MSDITDQTGADDEGGDDRQVTLPRANIRQLEKAAKEGKAALERATALERELAFRDAGISPTDERLRYFMKGYEGESTPEAIRAEALRAGFLTDGQEPPPGPPQQELDAMQRSNTVVSAPQTPSVSQDAAYFAELSNAKSPAEIMQVMQKFKIPTPGMD